MTHFSTEISIIYKYEKSEGVCVELGVHVEFTMDFFLGLSWCPDPSLVRLDSYSASLRWDLAGWVLCGSTYAATLL